ncbi:MAG: 30S ribosomal protein S6 [Clostridia bacterium]|nr:30S ribosomal protein S6 [Clostridia bacterium]
MAVINSYEAVIVVSLKQGEEAVAETVKKFKELIEKNATIESVDEWGKRKLSYPINKETDAYYVLFNFKSEAEFPAELDRVTKITDGILRSMIIKKEEA